MVVNPVLILVVIAVFLVLLAWILPKVVRRLRRMLASARAFFGGQPVATAARR
jgi:predicted permease